jgi:hypothetical protein
VRNSQNKAKNARSAPPQLLPRENYEIRAATSVDICGLSLSARGYSILLISLNIPLKLTSIYSIVSMMYTAKFEPRFRRFQTATLLDNCEALREGPALKTLFTDVRVVEDLASDWGR